MSLERNRGYFERLVSGCISRQHLDKPTYGIPQMCPSISLDFNDERVVIEIPSHAIDVEGVEDINPNGISRIRIQRDGDYLSIFSYYLFHSTQLT